MNDGDAIKKRKIAAKKIIDNYRHYKVCEGCESVVLKSTVFCPICEAYRFDSKKDRIIKTVKVLEEKAQTVILPSDFI